MVVGAAVDDVGLSFILAPGVPVRADPVGPRLPRVFSMAVSPMLDMKFIPALKGLDPGTLQERHISGTGDTKILGSDSDNVTLSMSERF